MDTSSTSSAVATDGNLAPKLIASVAGTGSRAGGGIGGSGGGVVHCGDDEDFGGIGGGVDAEIPPPTTLLLLLFSRPSVNFIKLFTVVSYELS